MHQVADAVVSLWREIELRLTPIIGARGVAALHGRSLFLTAREHAWLATGPDRVAMGMDLNALRLAVLTQDAGAALTGGGALFVNFHDLLTSMVGPALTERLLRDVWAPPSNGLPAQDIQP